MEMEEPYFDVRSTLQRLSFYYTPPAMADAVNPNPTLEDLAAGTPSSKILAMAEASQKRKASTSGATSGHVAKRTRSTLAQSFGSTTQPNLFVGDSNDESDGNDDACVEIPLVTPSATMIPSSENQGQSSAAPAAKSSNTRDSQGKGIMVDVAAVPSSGTSQPRPSSRPAPSFKDVSDDAIHMDFFPFSVGPYYATYLEGGVAGNCKCTCEEWDAPYRPTFGEGSFQGSCYFGELLARYHGLNQSHHEYVLSTDSRLKGYEEKVANMTGLELQVAALKKQVFRLNDKLTSSDASFAKSKAKGKESVEPLLTLLQIPPFPRVHFSQLGPVGLNKVITFDLMCQSFQIEPTVTLFRVFQTLCKQSDWYSFAKSRAPFPVCIDDKHSCMKHWKSGFFFIDRRAIPNVMVWRHPNAAIDDPRHAAVIVVMGIHDFLCLPEWTGAEVQEEPHLDVRPTLQRLPFYCTPPATAEDVIPDPTPEDLAVGTPMLGFMFS
ncbi:hypothetical protein Tco_1300306 [Tanacetum coccineum]